MHLSHVKTIRVTFLCCKDYALFNDNQNIVTVYWLILIKSSEQQGPKDKYKGHNHPLLRQETFLRSADKVGRPFCFCSVFSFFLLLRSTWRSQQTFLFFVLFFLFLRFPTLVGNLSVFVLFLLIKVSDVSRKPFCFRFVFSYYSLFFIFLLYFPHHCPSITSSIFNRLT